MTQESGPRDKMRVCPTCRMEISIFATKCRFCGEAVGRPRDEARKLTIDDLGGTSMADYAPSEEVVDALEQFRREELQRRLEAEDQEEEGWFGRRRKKDDRHPRGSSFDQLDPRSRELANTGQGGARNRSRPRRGGPSLFTKKLALGAGFVAAVVLLVFGYQMVRAGIDEYNARKNAVPAATVDNHALAILQNGNPLDALKEAVDVLKKSKTPDNLRIAETVRQAVVKDIQAKLNADNWSDTLMRATEAEMNRIADIDSDSETIAQLQKEVRKEVQIHTITFTDPSPDQGTVTLRLVDNQKPVDFAKVGEIVNGRLEIMNVTRDHVRFKDHARKTSRGIPRQVILDKLGSFASE